MRRSKVDTADILERNPPLAMYRLYSVLLFVYFVSRLPSILYASGRGREAAGSVAERFGRLPERVNPHRRPSIWVHAVSVGEALAARPLLSGLRANYPDHRLLLSTTTATGREVAERFGRHLVDAVFYVPFDFTPFVNASLDRVSPQLLVIIDTEIWPNLFRACRLRGSKIVMVNGRLSNRSFRGYKMVKGFMRRVVRNFDRVGVQTNLWKDRFVALGVHRGRIAVTGSLKFDVADSEKNDKRFELNDSVLTYFHVPDGRQVVVAASTLKGEEEPVLRAFSRLRKDSIDSLLVLAPRHKERFAEAEQIALHSGFSVARRTALPVGGDPAADVVILDTLGELPRLYQLASVVFVGGSLVPAGGHNILEPAVFGKAIVFGPYMESFAEISRKFLARGAAVQVRSASELENTLVDLVTNKKRCTVMGEAARQVLKENRGATQRTLTLIQEVFPPIRDPLPR